MVSEVGFEPTYAQIKSLPFGQLNYSPMVAQLRFRAVPPGSTNPCATTTPMRDTSVVRAKSWWAGWDSNPQPLLGDLIYSQASVQLLNRPKRFFRFAMAGAQSPAIDR